jgi:hypothetical protein
VHGLESCIPYGNGSGDAKVPIRRLITGPAGMLAYAIVDFQLGRDCATKLYRRLIIRDANDVISRALPDGCLWCVGTCRPKSHTSAAVVKIN